MNIIRVVVVDDHPVVREGVKRIIGKSAGIELVGEGADGLEAVDLVRRCAPDILVLDINMPGMNGFQVLEQLKADQTKTKVIILSAYKEKVMVNEAISLGAWNYFLKEEAPYVLVKAIQEAYLEMSGKSNKSHGYKFSLAE